MPSPKKPEEGPHLAEKPYDPELCRARFWNAGHGGQCWRRALWDGDDHCTRCGDRRDNLEKDYWGCFDEPLGSDSEHIKAERSWGGAKCHKWKNIPRRSFVDSEGLAETMGIYIREEAASTIQKYARRMIVLNTLELPVDQCRIGANMIVTPVSQSKTSRARVDYEEQISRRREGKTHVWDDGAKNRAVVGDLFAFVENSVKICPGSLEMTQGWIKVFKINQVYLPSSRLPSWSGNVGQGNRNVVELSRDSLYEGTMVDWRKTLGYKVNFKVQGTIQISHERIAEFIGKF
jgi:hypothetical protein